MHAFRKRTVTSSRFKITRIGILKWFFVFLFALLAVRMFQLQVVDHYEYSSYADQRLKSKVIPARRGSILLQDGENEFFELASNVTLYLLFADPKLIENPREVADQIVPVLFESTKSAHRSCGDDERCYLEVLEDSFLSEKRREEQEEFEKRVLLDPDYEPPEKNQVTEASLMQEYTDLIIEKMSQKEKGYSILKLQVNPEILKQVQDLRLPGIHTGKNYVWANPLEITGTKSYSEALSPLLDISEEEVLFSISKRENRYIRLHQKIDFDTRKHILSLGIKGIGFEEEFWRRYAEQNGMPFSPQLLGFLDHEGNPVYGIEKSMNDVLSGRRGIIRGEVDLQGRTLTARSSLIEEAQDGQHVVLTIDHVVQNKIEELLKRQVELSEAMSGEVVVQNPQTGEIIAMAMYPGFNPNSFGGVYQKEPIQLSKEERESVELKEYKDGKRYYLPLNPGYKVELFKTDESDEEHPEYLVYSNRIGIRAYRNAIVSDIYEPGSVFKAIVMAAAIDSKEIRPTDTYRDSGPLEVDCTLDDEGLEDCEYTIKNSNLSYYGQVTMTQILEKSLNTGMAFIAKKLGPSLLYHYLTSFGFGEKSYIELPDEESGKLPHYRNWISESDLITKAFGQGVAVTPIQMVNAFSAVVNGGILMQPTVVAGVIDEHGEFHPHEPRVVRRVISEEASITMKGMLVSSVERGVAHPAAIEHYMIAGKTGTSQIATGGLYETGPGSTIATFGGYAPFEDPRFVILVKVNRPRSGQLGDWGATNAAPLFKDIASFMLQYYQIPPDKSE